MWAVHIRCLSSTAAVSALFGPERLESQAFQLTAQTNSLPLCVCALPDGALSCLPCKVTRTLGVLLGRCRQAGPVAGCPLPPPMHACSHLAACRSRCLLTEAAAACAPMVSRAWWSCCRHGLMSSLLLCRNTRISASFRAAPQLASTPDCWSPGCGNLNTP